MKHGARGHLWRVGSSILSKGLLRYEFHATSWGRRDNAQRIPSTPAVRSVLEELFDTVERVRYATESDLSPFLAVGTAPLIDTVELFLVRAQRSGLDSGPPLITSTGQHPV